MPDHPRSQKTAHSPAVIGWREYVALPDWGVEHIKAKADTGARTSAIDVANLELLPGDRARFDIVVDRKHPEQRTCVETAIVRHANVKSSLGAIHTRPVVATRLRIGQIEKIVELGLVCRKGMTCRMLLGRAALSPEVLVDSSKRYLLGRGKRHTHPNRRGRGGRD